MMMTIADRFMSFRRFEAALANHSTVEVRTASLSASFTPTTQRYG